MLKYNIEVELNLLRRQICKFLLSEKPQKIQLIPLYRCEFHVPPSFTLLNVSECLCLHYWTIGTLFVQWVDQPIFDICETQALSSHPLTDQIISYLYLQ